MELTTYCSIDTDNLYTGHQRTSTSCEGDNFIKTDPPSLKVGEQARWNGTQWQLFRSNTGNEQARWHAFNLIDHKADVARKSDQSIGQLLNLEYMQVEEAHAHWYSQGYPRTAIPIEIQSWADAEDMSVMDAARSIAEAAASRQEIIRSIRDIRLKAKAAVRSAPTDADFMAIAQPYLEQFEALSIPHSV